MRQENRENFFSVICACKDEEKDIKFLINSFINIKEKNIELIFVDDSSDNTKKIIKLYQKKDQRIKLINGKNHGCCEARNLGIRNSKGDIIIFMTADSFFSKNFIKRISLYYNKGYSAVMVNSQVSNTKNIFANFINCSHKKKLDDRPNFSPYTTQGYSVDKKSALSVNLIDKGIFKPNICRDWTLIKKMDMKKFKKIFLKDTYCYHIAPSDINDFYKTHFTRGQISSGYKFFFLQQTKFKILLTTSIKFLIFLLYFLTIFSWVSNVYKISKQNDTEQKVFMKFLLIDLLKRISLLIGELLTTIKLKKS